MPLLQTARAIEKMFSERIEQRHAGMRTAGLLLFPLQWTMNHEVKLQHMDLRLIFS